MKLHLITLLSLPLLLPAQLKEYVYRNPEDSTYNCYLKVIPDTKEIRGLIIRDFSRLPDTSYKSPYQFLDLSSQAGFMTIYTVSSPFFPELYYDDSGPALLDEIVNEVLKEYSLKDKPVFIGGISASGTRALRYTQYCEAGKSRFGTRINGVFAADPPLDLERFYHSAQRIEERQLPGSMLEESSLVLKAFTEQMGGTPSEVQQAYQQASVYSYTLPEGENTVYFKDVPLIIYHEPDMDWWISERKADYRDINSIDIVGFINELRILGNTDAMQVSTSGKGFDRQGNRKPHSWTIVDEEQLIAWILQHTKAP